MINIKELLESEDVAKSVALWLADRCDGSDLADAAEYALHTRISVLSVIPTDVPIIWPWVENFNIKLLARFNVSVAGVNAISGLVQDIKNSFKHGADGAQIIIKLDDIERLVNMLLPIRDDLFFGKYLSIGLDIFEIWPLDWERVFDALRKLRVDSVLLIMTHDDAEKSDFTGRLYAALQGWDMNSNMELHVMLNESYSRASQVYRLISGMRPHLLDNVKFFISY